MFSKPPPPPQSKRLQTLQLARHKEDKITQFVWKIDWYHYLPDKRLMLEMLMAQNQPKQAIF